MRKITTIVLLLLFASPLRADVKLPAEVKGKPDSWIIIIPVERTGGEIKYKLGAGLELVDLGGLFPGAKPAGIVVKSSDAGTYEVWAWNAKGDVASDLSVCKVVIGDGKPTPPTPPIPPPDDPVVKAFQSAYDSEQDAQKAKLIKSLAALYRQAGSFAFLDTCATGKELFSKMSEAATTLGLSGKLSSVQKAVNAEMGKRFKLTEGQAMDAATKATVSAAFLKIAASLEGVKP